MNTALMSLGSATTFHTVSQLEAEKARFKITEIEKPKVFNKFAFISNKFGLKQGKR